MGHREKIRIVTEEFDPHADIVIILLRQMGHNPIRLHTADFPTQSLIKMGFEANHWNGALYVEMRWETVENC